MNSRAKVRLLIIDDHPVVRDGLSALPELDSRIVVVAAAGSGAEARSVIDTAPVDVVLLDIRLPDISGIDLCRHIKQDHPRLKVLLLTSFAENDLILAAMEAGADGYLLKVNPARRIIEAIDLVLGGGTVFDPVTPALAPSRPEAANSPLAVLSEQETRVLAEVAAGKTDKEAAVALGLSAKTVRNYLDRIFGKLQVNTRTQAAMLFARHAPDLKMLR